MAFLGKLVTKVRNTLALNCCDKAKGLPIFAWSGVDGSQKITSEEVALFQRSKGCVNCVANLRPDSTLELGEAVRGPGEQRSYADTHALAALICEIRNSPELRASCQYPNSKPKTLSFLAHSDAALKNNSVAGAWKGFEKGRFPPGEIPRRGNLIGVVTDEFFSKLAQNNGSDFRTSFSTLSWGSKLGKAPSSHSYISELSELRSLAAQCSFLQSMLNIFGFQSRPSILASDSQSAILRLALSRDLGINESAYSSCIGFIKIFLRTNMAKLMFISDELNLGDVFTKMISRVNNKFALLTHLQRCGELIFDCRGSLGRRSLDQRGTGS